VDRQILHLRCVDAPAVDLEGGLSWRDVDDVDVVPQRLAVRRLVRLATPLAGDHPARFAAGDDLVAQPLELLVVKAIERRSDHEEVVAVGVEADGQVVAHDLGQPVSVQITVLVKLEQVRLVRANLFEQDHPEIAIGLNI
jgi:hypothetical protein